MADAQRPLGVGFFFSLGHSTVVFLLAFLVGIGVNALSGQLVRKGSTLHHVTSLVGTSVSGSFLYVIAIINVVVLIHIVKWVFRDAARRVRRGRAGTPFSVARAS